MMNIFLKAFLFLVSFSIFHFGYEVTKLPILKIFCGTLPLDRFVYWSIETI